MDSSDQKSGIRIVTCPCCGKELHTFHIPSKAGRYRVRCQSDSDKMILLDAGEDGEVREHSREKQ